MGEETPRAVVLATLARAGGSARTAWPRRCRDAHAPRRIVRRRDGAARVGRSDGGAGSCPGRRSGVGRRALRAGIRRRLGRRGRGAGQPAAARHARQRAEGRPRQGGQGAGATLAPSRRRLRRTGCASRRPTARGATPTCRSSRPSRRAGSRSRTRAARSPPLLAGARPGEQVLDLCAGAGGKTLAHGGGDGRQGPGSSRPTATGRASRRSSTA